MTALFLYDDAVARAFEPFALTRPASELRVGALLLRERWERAIGARAYGVVTSAHLRDFDEAWGVSVASGVVKKGSLVANSRFAVALAPVVAGDVLRAGGRIAAVVLDRDVDAAELSGGSLDGFARKNGRVVDVEGRWMDNVWDCIAHLTPMLAEDIAILAADARQHERDVFVEERVTIEPHVHFDVTAGPVLLRRGASVQAFSRIVGPCVVGQDSTVVGGKVAASAVGDTCKISGEMSNTIALGHANKAHDGFVGHSYVGRWVNLGAGTTTSNLKNTYGPVQLWTPAGQRDTGLQFLGTLFGDHVKTGIGTLLNTGTVLGAGANIYGSTMPPKVVPPFAWGDGAPYQTYQLDKFIDVARLMMERRHVRLSDQQARQLTAAYNARWAEGGRKA